MTDILAVESRLQAIERRQDEVERRLTHLDDKMAENTVLTNSIKIDTQQIVAFFKASQLGATIIKWLTGIGASLIVAYAAWKGLTH